MSDDSPDKPQRRQRKSHGAMTPERLTQLERTTKAMELRRRGFSYLQIARELGITQKAVCSLINVAFRALQRYCKETTEQTVQLHNERLEAMYKALEPSMQSGHARSIEVGLKVLERQAKMLGLDAPEKQELKVAYTDHTDEELLREAERLKVDVRVLGIETSLIPLPGEDPTTVPSALLPAPLPDSPASPATGEAPVG